MCVSLTLNSGTIVLQTYLSSMSSCSHSSTAVLAMIASDTPVCTSFCSVLANKSHDLQRMFIAMPSIFCGRFSFCMTTGAEMTPESKQATNKIASDTARSFRRLVNSMSSWRPRKTSSRQTDNLFIYFDHESVTTKSNHFFCIPPQHTLRNKANY